MASPEVELLKSGNGFPEVVTDQEDDEHDAKESVLQKYFLQEWRVVKCVLENIVSSDGAVEHSAVHKIRSIIDKYQEQGQLLEPYLESMVSPLMILIRSKIIELDQGVYSHEILEVIRSLCIIIYSLVTVCGYKAVIKFFPHQVSDLEAAVFLLGKCHDTNAATSLREESTGEMESKCVILLWLSILVLVPFDISSVDTSIRNSNDLGEYEPAPLVLRLLALSKDYLSSAGPMRKISGLLLSKLLTRPDMPKAFSSFIGWSHEVLSSTTDHLMDHFQLLGAVEALCAIFKAGSRELLLDVIPTVWNDTSILIKTKTAARSPLLRKLVMKLTQKIGLIRLPRRSPSWQYVSKTTSLRDNRISNASSKTNECNHTVNAPNLVPMLSCQEDEDMDVPEIVEEIIGILLSGLRDTDTVVRWSAAKGIGRMTSRLTSILADEILCSLLELFSAGEGDASWHGGCLALAELARRGLLLPISLPKVVPVVVKALHYDIRRGPHSIGSHVRDAAAYVCWAFGRAYIHTDMKSILEQLAPNLLIVACYDREVNCRRAAAAAFQENVGRQGNYPHGINIVNTADYFSLSSRVNSYLHVAVSVAQYEGYLYPFVEELLNSKICHWEKGLREIAAEALSALVKYDPEYFAHFVMEKVAPCTLSNDLCMRHGATLAAGEVSLALHRLSYALSTDMQKLLAGMVPAIEKARLYRGKGGEIMRSAVSRFIHCISLVCIHLPAKTKQSLLDTLNENLRHPNDRIQKAAAEALKYFVPAYFVPADGGASIDIIQKYLEQLTDANVATRRGAALGLGVLPYGFLAKRWRAVLLKLCNSCAIEDNPEDRDTEARVNAVKALVSVSETINQARGHAEHSSEEDGTSFFLLIKNEILTSLFVALDDYSVDNRGDVGSWVREASIYGLERCTYMLCKEHAIRSYNKMVEDSQSQLFFDMNLANRIVGGILKQAVEKMDKIREVAAKTLQRILYNDTVFVPFIPYREKLEEVIPKEADLNWGVPVFSYPRIVQLLSLSCYSRYLLSGLVISVGGLQDSLRKASLSALLKYLQANEDEICSERSSREIMLYKDMLWLLEQYKKCDRVIIPTLKTIEILLSKKIFLNMEAHTTIFCSGISDSLAVELKGAKDFSKLYAGIAILGYIASIAESVNTPSFSQLLSFLDHRFPKIRKAAAEQVYLVLLQNGNLVAEDKMDKALEVVSEACWEGDIKEAKNRRWQLYDIVGMDKGPLHANGGALNAGCPKRPADENASYSSLVESSGF